MSTAAAPDVLTRPAEWDDRFSKAILISAIAHTVLIFGLHFKVPDPALFQDSHLPIEVVLVNARSPERPLAADVLAQHQLDGGGTVEEDVQATSPLPASPLDQTMSAEAELQTRIQALEAQAQALMQQAQSSYQTPPQPPRPEADPRPASPVPAPADLTQRSLEMARLQARIDQNWQEYQRRPRRMFVGARAQEYTFAQYVDDWRIKVERIGNLNYPEAARREGIYGSLRLTVNIRADGSVESVDLDRSSGSRILDAAAVRIVEMAAPFPPFTPAMRDKVDILGITRTWTFTRSDRLTSQ